MARFSLSTHGRLAPLRGCAYAGSSTYDCDTYGPTFGAGHDFYTNLSTDAYAFLGNSYACRVGAMGSAECRNDFAGAYNPSMIELEVYAAQ